jgi:hypothetical protein
MISALLDGFGWIIKKPSFLLPCLLSAALLLGLMVIADSTIQGFVFDLTLNNALPQGNTAELPFLLYAMYPLEINFILVLLFVSGIIANWLAFCLARFAKEEKGILSAMGFATAKIGNAFFLTVLEALVIGFFSALALLAIQLGTINELFGIAAGIVFAAIGFLVYLIFIFLPAALAVNEMTIKEALKESGAFVKKRVISAVVFIIILGFLFSLISNLGTNIRALFNDDLLFFLIDFVFLLLAIAYSGITVPLYYLSARK